MQSEIELEAILTANEQRQARNIGEVLEQKYPEWGWIVMIKQGCAFIRSLRLSGTHGFILKVDQIDNDYKAVVNAGGEMLERFGFERTGFNYEKWMQAPMLMSGNMRGDLSES